jgi:hypothetical protein
MRKLDNTLFDFFYLKKSRLTTCHPPGMEQKKGQVEWLGLPRATTPSFFFLNSFFKKN